MERSLTLVSERVGVGEVGNKRNAQLSLRATMCSRAKFLQPLEYTVMLFSVDGIGDSEMVFGEMRLRIRHILPDIRLTVGENVGKNPIRKILKDREFTPEAPRKSAVAMFRFITGHDSISVTIGFIVLCLLEQNDAKSPYDRELNQCIRDCATKIIQQYFAKDCALVLSVSTSTNITENVGHFFNKLHHQSQWTDSEDDLLKQLHVLNERTFVVSTPTGIFRKPHKSTDWDTHNDDQHRYYVLIIQQEDIKETLLDLRRQLKQLQSFSAWNPRARFMILVNIELNYSALLETLWHWLLLNSVILIPNLTNLVSRHKDITCAVDIVTHFPYQLHYGAFGETVLLDTYITRASGGYFLQNNNLFPEKIPKDMNEYPFRVSVGQLPPFTMYYSRIEGNANITDVSGIEKGILECLAQKMNLSLKLSIVYGDSPWGILVNETWTGLKGDILYNRSDAAISGWIQNLEAHLLFDESMSYFMDRIALYVPRSKQLSRWMSVSRVFHPRTWIALLFSILLAAVVFRLLSSPFDARHYTSIAQCLSSSWSMLLGVSVVELPLSIPLRIFILSWVMYSMAISTIFQTFMTSYFVNPGFEYQVSNVEDLKDANFQYLFQVFYDNFLGDEMLTLLNPRVQCNSPLSCFKYAVNGTMKVLLTSRFVFPYIAEGLMVRERHRILFPFKDDMLQTPIVMILKKGYPLRDTFDNIIIRMIEGGLVRKFMNDIVYTKYLKDGISFLSDSEISYIPLSVTNLYSSFVLLFLGLGLSSLIMVMEVTYVRYTK
ncbi:hypothetical protein ANN_20911 [Periplaneta americana]|uniref:Uncharacterized protein n=1 Tax=Periplaneta americana TaxID=6978 RepID=A0ABQ8SED1_PERAM|nr:hypothetical protein ANN_20911 [Periplaneta americana]